LQAVPNPDGPDISVVVSTRNRASDLAELLAALSDQTLAHDRFEVIVVNDGSTDGTRTLLDEAAARWGFAVRPVNRPKSNGPAVGRDEGWRIARAPLIAFTDDDCVPDPEWLERGLETASANPGAFVQGRTAPRPDQLDQLSPWSRTMDVAKLGPDFPATNVFYPRDLLETLDGWDTEAFADAAGGEDTDLAWRAIGSGARPVYEPRSLTFHAVQHAGARGRLRVAARKTAVLPFARHPGARRNFVLGVFRKPVHLHFTLATAGLLLSRRFSWLGIALAIPYLRSVRARGIIEGGGPRVWPFFVLHDLVEVWATITVAVKTRRLMI
jgi:glycosyltransferase involved in cell wall biosynthesis